MSWHNPKPASIAAAVAAAIGAFVLLFVWRSLAHLFAN